jgi:hypothetical protein
MLIYLLSITVTGSSLRSIRETNPPLTATTATGIGSVNSQGTGLKKLKLKPLGA